MRYVSHAATITISCSGPEKVVPAYGPGGVRQSRAGADLRFTKADGKFFDEHFGENGIDYSIVSRQWLIEPAVNELKEVLHNAAVALSYHAGKEGWNGGGIIICYAGHGADISGALILRDGHVTAQELGQWIVDEAIPSEGPRHVDLVLDSCFAGGFLAEFLAVASQNSRSLRIIDARIASLHNEKAWEHRELGHGTWTYTFRSSFEPHNLSGSAELATAVNVNDQRIIQKELHRFVPNPVTYLTEGQQHVVEITNGHYVEVQGGGSFSLPLGKVFTADQVKQTLTRALHVLMGETVEFADA
jgi:hypothetical protein